MDLDHTIIGFRAWIPHYHSSDLDGQLRSVYTEYWWKPGVNTAHCKRDLSFHPQSSIPAARCHCGLYAMHDWLPGWGEGRRVWGIVRGWGPLRCHYHGWRSQYAEIAAIIDTKNSQAPLAAQYYGVPLLSPQSVNQIASEFGKPVPKEWRPTTYRLAPTAGEEVYDIVTSLVELGYTKFQALRKKL